MVEASRELFTKLHRDKDRREGALVICCELLRLYHSLGQVEGLVRRSLRGSSRSTPVLEASQSAFVFTTVGQGLMKEFHGIPTKVTRSGTMRP